MNRLKKYREMRMGEVRTMNNGLRAKIIQYRKANDIDIEFLDAGTIVTNTRYSHFKSGKIKCPLLIEDMGECLWVTNANTNPRYKFLIDKDDLPLLGAQLWGDDGSGYARCNDAARERPRLHRLIMGAKPGEQVDHINGNRMDYRKLNLRICTALENACNRRICANNTSGYKGVYWKSDHKKWEAYITREGARRHIGYFDSAIDAAFAYNEAAIKLHGEFARLNGSAARSKKKKPLFPERDKTA